MSDFTASFRAHARSVGADLIGIAPIERFSDLPAERHPSTIFPEVKSVVIVGKRVTRGTLRGVEEGTQFDLYAQYGRDWLNNRVLAMATFRTSEFLENNGWEAVPLPNLPPETPPMGIPVKPGLPAPNVMLDFDDAAVRAGLGEIGYCGLFLTPEFGPRQRLQIILTDAELEANPILERAICTRCQEHAAICPLGAINGDAQTVTIAGKTMAVADINYAICQSCKNGAFPNSLHASGKPDRLAALCTRNCIAHLEETCALETTFHEPFRKREPWGIIDEQRRL